MFHQLDKMVSRFLILASLLQLCLSVPQNKPLYDTSALQLDGSSCWKQECSLGDLIADSMMFCGVSYFSAEYNHKNMKNAEILNKIKDASMGDTDIFAFWNSGSMAGKNFNLPEEVTTAVVKEWLGKDVSVSLAIIKGKYLRRILETSATALKEPYLSLGHFLQTSRNVKLTYRKTSTSTTVSSISILCSSCDSQIWKPLEDEYSYHVVIPSTGFIDLQLSTAGMGGIVTQSLEFGEAHECISSYLSHLPNGVTEENNPGGRIVIEKGFAEIETGQETAKQELYIEMRTSYGLQNVISIITMVLLIVLLVIAAFTFVTLRKKEFQVLQYDRMSFAGSQAGLTKA